LTGLTKKTKKLMPLKLLFSTQNSISSNYQFKIDNYDCFTKIKKVLIDRNKAYMRLDGEKSTSMTNEIEILLPKIVKDEDRKLVLKWLNEKNEKQYHILLEA